VYDPAESTTPGMTGLGSLGVYQPATAPDHTWHGTPSTPTVLQQQEQD